MIKNLQSKQRIELKNDDFLLENDKNTRIHRQTLPDNLGGYSDIFQLENDLSYIETRYKPVKHLSVLSKIDSQEPRLVITLGLKGQSYFVNNENQEIVFKEGYTSITAFDSITGERQFQSEQEIIQLRFSMGKRWLDKYFGEKNSHRFFQQDMMQTLSNRPTSYIGMRCAQQLVNCQLPKEFKPMFIHGQAISIITAELTCLFEEKKPCKPCEYETAQRAFAILKLEFKTPPSVAELASRVNVNESKLKKLFHDIFNDTVYGVLLTIRMEIAYQLLQANVQSVAHIAEFVGYGHLSNFSTAFTRYFGFPPKNIKLKKH